MSSSNDNDEEPKVIAVKEKKEEEEEQNTMVDITSLIEEAASALTVSDPMICQPSSFSLLDSMSALELMDRKMDCCELPASTVAPIANKTTKDDNGKEEDDERMVFPRPAPTSLLNDPIQPLPWESLTLQDAARIALEAFIRLESMLSGASVVESVYTCLYAHKPVLHDMQQLLYPTSSEEQQGETTLKGTLPQHLVYATALMLVEQTDAYRGIIASADIYEEEDFTFNTYDFPVFERSDPDMTLRAVLDGLNMLNQEPACEENKEAALVIAYLFEFQIDLMSTSKTMAQLSGTKEKDATKVVSRSQAKMCVAAAKLEEALKVAKVLMKKVDDDESSSFRTKAMLQMAFDSHVNRPLVGNAPVRKIIFKPMEESLRVMITIAQQFDSALCSLILKGSSLARIRRILSRISIQTPNILIRSLIVLNLYFNDKIFGKYILGELIVKQMQHLSFIPDTIFQARCTVAFLNRLGKPIYDLMKVQMLNRNRQRTYIESVMIHDWAALQQEASLLDVTYRKELNLEEGTSPHFSLYVMILTVELMEHFLALGVELGLFYGHKELSLAFWYRDYLLASQVTQMSQLRIRRQEIMAHERDQAQLAAKAHKGKKKGGKHGKKGGNGASVPDLSPTKEDAEFDFDLLMLGMKRHLCKGIVRFIAASAQAGVLRDKEFQFTTDEKLFEKKFEAFAVIPHPSPLFYDDYLQGSDFAKVPQDDLLTATTECFMHSKSFLDNLTVQATTIDEVYLPIPEIHLRDLTKVCIGNSIYIQKLRQVIASEEKKDVQVDFDLDTHNQFCIMKLM